MDFPKLDYGYELNAFLYQTVSNYLFKGVFCMNHPVFQNWIVQKIIFQNYFLALSIGSMGTNCVRVCFEKFLSVWICIFQNPFLKNRISKLKFAFSKKCFLLKISQLDF